jgi:hypothetical protein
MNLMLEMASHERMDLWEAGPEDRESDCDSTQDSEED